MDEYGDLGYILTGCILYIFGLKWCCEYAKYWLPSTQNSDRGQPTKIVRFSQRCRNLVRRHPFEGTLKLLATALGLAGTLTGGLPYAAAVSPKEVHVTIYLFFALSGLVDVLTFYFPTIVGDGLSKMALAQSFFIEGFLLLWSSPRNEIVIYIILFAIVCTTSFAIVLELVWPETKLLRASSTLLHASWLAHMVRDYRVDVAATERVALTFSWHLSIAFVVTLCLVSITRSCAPRATIKEPPEVPIYDYCTHETEDRV